MKKILAIALALVLVCSMGMVALAEDPAPGTKENPYQISTPMQFPKNVDVPANSTVYYAYNMQFFSGMSIVVQGVDAVTMNDVDVPYSPVDWGFKAELTSVNPMYPCVIGYVNNTEEDVQASVNLVQPAGTEDNKYELEEGTNDITMSMDVLNMTMGMYYTSLYVEWEGGFDVSAVSTTEGIVGGFDVLVRYMDEEMIDQEVVLTADAEGVVAGHVDVPSYTGATIIIACMDMLETVELTVAGPAVGSEARPIELYGDYDLENFTIEAGETVYVDLCGFAQKGNTLYIDSDVTATINGQEGNYLELTDEDYVVSLKLTNEQNYSISYPVWVEYPAGTEQNPEWVEDGDTHLYYDGNAYHYVYNALNDGTVTVKVDNIDTIAGLLAENVTVTGAEDYDYADYDKYFDYMNKHADKDENGDIIYDDETGLPVFSDASQYYVTVTVNKGDEVVISFEGGKWDDEGNPIPMEAVVTVEGPEAPLGHYANMDEFEAGKNEFTVSGEDTMYIGTWIAPADGTITITVTGDVSEFLMGHIETDDPLIMSEDDKLVLDVKKGDEIAFVALAGMNGTNGVFVDTDVVLDIDFVEAKTDSPATGATGAGVAVLLTLISGAGLAVINKKRG